jgi:hypothetical protein
MAIDSTEIPTTTTAGTSNQSTTVVEEQLFCALTGKPISTEEAYWAPPLVTTRQLVTTILNTLIRSPGNLGYVLLAEQPNVPYAQDAREQLAARRSTEQLKLLLGLLLVVALIAAPILFLTMR